MYDLSVFDGVGGEFEISQLVWVIKVSGSKILGNSAGCISVRGIGGRCGVDCVLISHVIYVSFFNISVCSFSPDGRKWASEAMAEATTAIGVDSGGRNGGRKTAAYGLDSFLTVTGHLVSSLVVTSFVPLVCVLAFPLFVSVNVFAF